MGKEQAHITKFLKTIMIVTGTWRQELTNNKITETLYTIYSVVMQFSYLYFVLALVFNLPSLLIKQDIQLLIENVGYTIVISVMVFKVAISQTRRIRNLIRHCNLEEIRTYKEEPETIQNNIKRNVKVLNHVNLASLLLTIITASLLCISNYVEYTKYKDYNISVEKPLPYPIWYPFNRNKHYGKAFIIAVYFTVTGAIMNVSTQVLFFTLMTFATLQIKALKIMAKNFHLYCKPYNYTAENEEKNMLAVLRHICVKHQAIIGFVDELNIALKNILFIEFLFNSLNIAAIMVQILIVPNSPSMKTYFVVFLIAQILQLFMMPWHANEIQTESISLSDALFESKWYAQSEKAKKIIYIIMMRSRKPLPLFIGPFYPMTNRTPLSTLKAAYSYLTMICAMASKE